MGLEELRLKEISLARAIPLPIKTATRGKERSGFRIGKGMAREIRRR